MTKSTHFLPVKSLFLSEYYVKFYIRETLRFHWVNLSIIFDWGTQFTYLFWKLLQKSSWYSSDTNTTLHTQTDGQTKHTIQTLEDILRAYVIDFSVTRIIIFLWLIIHIVIAIIPALGWQCLNFVFFVGGASFLLVDLRLVRLQIFLLISELV